MKKWSFLQMKIVLILCLFMVLLIGCDIEETERATDNVKKEINNKDCSLLSKDKQIQCIIDLYRNTREVGCWKFPDDSNDFEISYNGCVTALAVEFKDDSFCEDEIRSYGFIGDKPSQIEKKRCLNAIKESIPKSEINCEQEEGGQLYIDGCYLEKAKELGDISLCDKIKSTTGGITAEKCKMDVNFAKAIELADVNLCTEISFSDSTEVYTAKRDCIQDIAKKLNDGTICESIKSLKNEFTLGTKSEGGIGYSAESIDGDAISCMKAVLCEKVVLATGLKYKSDESTYDICRGMTRSAKYTVADIEEFLTEMGIR